VDQLDDGGQDARIRLGEDAVTQVEDVAGAAAIGGGRQNGPSSGCAAIQRAMTRARDHTLKSCTAAQDSGLRSIATWVGISAFTSSPVNGSAKIGPPCASR